VTRPPTDFELLRAIYERHKGDYEARAAAGGTGRIFVPIDIPVEAVLASLWQERDRDRRTLWISVISIGIAVASLVLSVLAITGQL
jgi:hypothetical protein